MKINILLLFLFATVLCEAQTKVIAHKSHSGSRQSFSKAYQNNLFDINRSNFGHPGFRSVVLLDTIIAVNDSLTVLKMRESNSCHSVLVDYKELSDSDFKSKTDTLINHEWLHKNNPKVLRELKKSSGGIYCPIEAVGYVNSYRIRFENPARQVVLIGFKENECE